MWEILKFLLFCFFACSLVSVLAFAYMIFKAPEEFVMEEPEDYDR